MEVGMRMVLVTEMDITTKDNLPREFIENITAIINRNSCVKKELSDEPEDEYGIWAYLDNAEELASLVMDAIFNGVVEDVSKGKNQ